MISEWCSEDAWLVVMECDGSSTDIDPSEESRLDAAVTGYVDSGGTRDVVLSLTMSEGGQYRILASRVVGWWLCTPEHRRRNLLRRQAQEEADRALRVELGLPWEE